jgi:hypothetical protein
MVSATTREAVFSRAGGVCEYCQLPEEFSPVARLQIEHVLPLKHGGTSDFDNLALACIDCNLRKGSNLTGIDPESGQITQIFNPRVQTWAEHFTWKGVEIEGRTSVGRATIRVMDLNSEDRLVVRSVSYRAKTR